MTRARLNELCAHLHDDLAKARKILCSSKAAKALAAYLAENQDKDTDHVVFLDYIMRYVHDLEMDLMDVAEDAKKLSKGRSIR